MPDIEELAADPRTIAALAAAGYERFDRHDALLTVGDMEVLYSVRRAEGRYTLNLKSRSSAEREICAADDLELVMDYLRFLLRSDVQVVHHGDILPARFEMESGAEGLTLVAPEAAWRVSVPDGTAARRELIAFATEGRER